ncbi:MAG TPA: tagaturonate epimerase family protein [Candidatus Methylomirabilis sp.]|nr:tagaturonate epimerase family protein [Candidatus Methylomirabilis sp.]HSB78581.1 tagaturonate epimerase family protein [Candidatus Methylomirabilis sp.]
MMLSKYSMGIGDRFARQGVAQLAAMVQAKALGVDIVPVWNKSNREHLIVHTHPDSVRAEADAAVRALGWAGPYHVDADHINLKNVDTFIAGSDFFTLDVADYVGQAAPEADIHAFVTRHRRYATALKIPGIERTLAVSEQDVAANARKYLMAVREAGAIFRHVEAAKGRDRFITEVSIDETDTPQTPVELLFILAAVADQQVPAQTIAPKFTGRFNKGVDYVGDVVQFEKEFNEDLAVIAFAVKEFGLPANLKLSVHSGSDKFSIYGPMARAIRKRDAGLHLKTAGTTWLEEVAGLALAGGDGLKLAQEIYEKAYARIDDLCKPYAAVIDIDRTKLPEPKTVRSWSGTEFGAALRHDQKCPAYNRHFRQLIHVGFKVAAEMGPVYYQALEANAGVIGRLVTENLLEKHVKPVFLGGSH